MSAGTGYIRSANKQRQFLSRFTIDAGVQRLIPSSTVSENEHISTTAVGLLLTHQPLVARFYWNDFFQVSKLINGRLNGFVTILPSGYDYDLTHTLYFLPLDTADRSIPTSELSIPGVELLGARTFERDELAVFLEAVHERCSLTGAAGARFTGPCKIVKWLDIETPGRDYFERPGLWLNKPGHEEYVGSLRRQFSLHLYSGKEIWIQNVGMDWPEYFFRLLSKGMCRILGGKPTSLTSDRKEQHRWEQRFSLVKGRVTYRDWSECGVCSLIILTIS